MYLAVAVALQREQDAVSDLDAGLIPVTVPELLRLLRDTVIPPPRRGPPAALVGLAAPPPAPRPPSSQPLERLRRGNTVIQTNYGWRKRSRSACLVRHRRPSRQSR
jgi:hypothetical protein